MVFSKITLLHWLLIVMGIKTLLYMVVVPIWHGPDEQAHFAQVQYIAELGRDIPHLHINDLSQEIYVSQQLLGTLRDNQGMNKFTLHPEHRLEYTNTTIGKHESFINKLPLSTRTTFTKMEATRYPPLFYYISAPFYRLAYPTGIFARVMMTRVTSAIMGILVVFIAFKISSLAFPQDPTLAITIPILVAFHPMFGFLTATVNSDNLMNLLFALFLYLCVRIIHNQKVTKKVGAAMITTMAAGLITKPHFAISFFIVMIMPLFLISSIKTSFQRHTKSSLIACSVFLGLFTLRFWSNIIGIIRGQTLAFAEIDTHYLIHPNHPILLINHGLWTIRHTIAEVIPWYWGVFNWLGVTLPRTVNRIINRAMIIAATGLLWWMIRNRHVSKWDSTQKIIVFLALAATTYFGVFVIWDWLFVITSGFSFGIQGRYYFPLLIAHMLLIGTGFVALTSKTAKPYVVRALGLAMITLHFIGFYTLLNAYYQLTPISTLLNQISQYKPEIFKTPWLVVWFTLYVISLGILIIKYLYYENNSRGRH